MKTIDQSKILKQKPARLTAKITWSILNPDASPASAGSPLKHFQPFNSQNQLKLSKNYPVLAYQINIISLITVFSTDFGRLTKATLYFSKPNLAEFPHLGRSVVPDNAQISANLAQNKYIKSYQLPI